MGAFGKKKGFKRLRKFVNGKSKEIEKIEDGGYLEDKWYRVAIKF